MEDTFSEKEKYILNLQKWSHEYKKEYSKLYYRIYLSNKETSQNDIKLYEKMRNLPAPDRGAYNKINNNEILSHNTGLKVEKKKVNITFD